MHLRVTSLNALSWRVELCNPTVLQRSLGNVAFQTIFKTAMRLLIRGCFDALGVRLAVGQYS
eukprot:4451061-Amphidinium_carterae.1